MNFNVNEILSGLNNFTQNSVNFLFGSKWSIWMIILLVICYFIYKGWSEEKKQHNQSPRKTPLKSQESGSNEVGDNHSQTGEEK